MGEQNHVLHRLRLWPFPLTTHTDSEHHLHEAPSSDFTLRLEITPNFEILVFDLNLFHLGT